MLIALRGPFSFGFVVFPSFLRFNIIRICIASRSSLPRSFLFVFSRIAAKCCGPLGKRNSSLTGTSRGQSLASGRTAGLVVVAGRPQGNLAAGNLQLPQQHGC